MNTRLVRLLKGKLTVDNDPFLKPSIRRVAHEEESIDKTNEPDLSCPSLAVY